MHEVNIDGIRLWSWIKVRYDSAAKLDTLRRYYGDNIRSIKIKSSGLLVKYIDWFHGLAILCKEIGKTVNPKYRLVTQMVKHIEDPICSSPYKSTNNWDTIKCTLHDAAAMLRKNVIS